MATQEENNKRHREKVRLSKLMHRISDQIAETGKEQAFGTQVVSLLQGQSDRSGEGRVLRIRATFGGTE